MSYCVSSRRSKNARQSDVVLKRKKNELSKRSVKQSSSASAKFRGSGKRKLKPRKYDCLSGAPCDLDCFRSVQDGKLWKVTNGEEGIELHPPELRARMTDGEEILRQGDRSQSRPRIVRRISLHAGSARSLRITTAEPLHKDGRHVAIDRLLDRQHKRRRDLQREENGHEWVVRGMIGVKLGIIDRLLLLRRGRQLAMCLQEAELDFRIPDRRRPPTMILSTEEVDHLTNGDRQGMIEIGHGTMAVGE